MPKKTAASKSKKEQKKTFKKTARAKSSPRTEQVQTAEPQTATIIQPKEPVSSTTAKAPTSQYSVETVEPEEKPAAKEVSSATDQASEAKEQPSKSDSLPSESDGTATEEAAEPLLEKSEGDGADLFEPEEPGVSGKKMFFVFLAALVVGAIIVGAYFFFQSKQQQTKPEEETTTKEQSSESEKGAVREEQEATGSAEDAEKELDLTAYSVQILNGSGVAGEAGAVQELLEGEGFEDINTGNAGSYDYEETEVQVKQSVSNKVFGLIKDMLDNYTVTEGNVLDDDSNYDIVIIVGAKK